MRAAGIDLGAFGSDWDDITADLVQRADRLEAGQAERPEAEGD